MFVALALLLPCLLGAGLARRLRLRFRDESMLFAATAIVLGFTASAIILAAALLAGIPLHRAWLLPLLSILALAAWLPPGRIPDSVPCQASIAPRQGRMLHAAASAVAVALLAVQCARIDLDPVVHGDESTIWAPKARALLVAGHFGHRLHEELHAEGVVAAHRDYPLANPLLQLLVFVAEGRSTRVVNRLPLQLMTLALVLLLAAALGRAIHPALAAAVLLATVLDRHALHFATLAYADALVSLGLFLALVGLHRETERRPAGTALAALGLLVATAAKNEGALVAVAVSLALLAARLTGLRSRRAPESPAPPLRLLLPALAVLALAWFLNHRLGLTNDLVDGLASEGSLGRTLRDLPRRTTAVFAFLVRPWPGDWPSRTLLAAFPLLCLLAPRHAFGRVLRIQTLALALILGGLLSVFILTPRPQDWHLETAAARVFSQAAPALAWWCASMAAALAPRLAPR